MEVYNKLEYNKRRGMALPAVLILCTLLILMIVPLLAMSLQQLKISKNQELVGYAYLASNSMTEQAMYYIQEYVNDTSKSYLTLYDPDPSIYATNIIGQLRTLIDTNLSKSIDVSGIATNLAKTRVKDIVLVGTSDLGDKIIITLGIYTISSYTRNMNSASGQEIYSEVVFEVEKPKTYFRPAAFNGIGDLFVKGYIDAKIKGDVKLVGTAPQKAMQPEQNYYGGIYARENSKLSIDGNAFVRAFIRCGDYDLDDKSYINIKNNAVAQCIQIFGNNDKILVQKDAYTFDDLEMNGMNSVIAVNRNFFGLSNGSGEEGMFHDASSAIVNSAVIHHPFEDSIEEAMKSKIIINGNVFINGGTFWIDPDTGEIVKREDKDRDGDGFTDPPVGQIEDASVAWNTEDELSTYKNFNFNDDTAKVYYHGNEGQGDFDLFNTYIYGEYDNTISRARGFGNLFQQWTPYTDSVDTENWFNNIVPNYMKKYSDFNSAGLQEPSKIRGYCNYEIAANGTMYFMWKQRFLPVKSYYSMTQVTKADMNRLYGTNNAAEKEFNESLYYLSNDDKKDFTDPNNANFWSKKWDGLASATWADYGIEVPKYLRKIEEPMLKLTEDFIRRKYKFELADKSIKNELIKDNNGVSMFDYIGNGLLECNNKDSEYVFTSSEMDMWTAPYNNNDKYFASSFISSKPLQADREKYYIIVNDNPEKTIVIDSEMYGIIYTKGQVLMKKGAKLHGFIIAAGRGCDASGNIDGSAAYDGKIPFILENGDNKPLLDNGSYSALYIEGTTNPADATSEALIDYQLDPADPSPEASLDVLLSKFNSQSTGIYSELYKLFKS